MAENKKELERAELHRTIWAIADEMRGAVDGWDFKAYILGMLFYRYISENITNYINKGKIDTTPLITHRFPLTRIAEAYELFEQKRDGVIKVAITQ